MVVIQHNYSVLARYVTLILGFIGVILPAQIFAATPVCQNGDGVHYESPDAACAGINGTRYGPPWGVATWSDMHADYVRNRCYGKWTFNGSQLSDYWTSAFCYCQTGPTSSDSFPMNFNMYRAGLCKTSSFILTLTSQSPPEPRPKGTEGKDGKSTLELIAKVMEGSTPKAGVAVTFAVEVAANSGGHDHHDASRPKGTVPANSPVTDANGEITVTFTASKVAGTHFVAAVCNSCSNTSVTKNVNVKVPDLEPLPEDSSAHPRYKLIGNTGSVGSKHLGNHYFSAESGKVFDNVLAIFAKHKWGQVGVNDASLIWGGKFDLGLRWGAAPTGGREESHQGHRTGDEVDISFGNPASISADKRRKVYDELDESEDVHMPEVLWHEFDNPATGTKAHFHLYLLSQKPSSIIRY